MIVIYCDIKSETELEIEHKAKEVELNCQGSTEKMNQDN